MTYIILVYVLPFISRFITGDKIWGTPMFLAGILASPLLFLKNKWVRYFAFMAAFFVLGFVLHQLLDVPIHNLRAVWTAPMAPHLDLIVR